MGRPISVNKKGRDHPAFHRTRAIREKQWHPAWLELEIVEQGIGILIGATAEVEGRDELADWIDGQS
jgi:hypothetical protein